MDQESVRKLTQARTVFSHVLYFGISATIGGSTVLIFHGIERNVDIIIFKQTDGNSVKQSLLLKHPSKYEMIETHLYFCEEQNKTVVEFLVGGTNSSLAWLRFEAEAVGKCVMVDGVYVLGLGMCLLSKMSACNTRMRSRLPQRAEKGKRDKQDVLLLAHMMFSKGIRVEEAWTGGALSGLEFFNEGEKELLKRVGACVVNRMWKWRGFVDYGRVLRLFLQDFCGNGERVCNNTGMFSK
jgi:hypothetical protein